VRIGEELTVRPLLISHRFEFEYSERLSVKARAALRKQDATSVSMKESKDDPKEDRASQYQHYRATHYIEEPLSKAFVHNTPSVH
jgi:hypothetical protein